jgi:S-adenosylmethionine hydrolase
LNDYFVGAMKGAILDINSSARVVDITHEIPPQAIEVAAFNLLAVYKTFGAGTIHVAVVDPGVGSARRPIVISAGGQFFVGPDNGIFSYVLDRESDARVYHVTNDLYFLKPTSATFHGRDVFAPIAAALSTGVSPRELGDGIDDPVRLKSLAPERLKHGKLGGRLIHIDRFGNCITNFTRNELPDKLIRQGARLNIKGKVVSEFREFFAGESKARLFALWGSAGFLEIVAPNRSAAKLLKAKRGDKILLELRYGIRVVSAHRAVG